MTYNNSNLTYFEIVEKYKQSKEEYSNATSKDYELINNFKSCVVDILNNKINYSVFLHSDNHNMITFRILDEKYDNEIYLVIYTDDRIQKVDIGFDVDLNKDITEINDEKKQLFNSISNMIMNGDLEEQINDIIKEKKNVIDKIKQLDLNNKRLNYEYFKKLKFDKEVNSMLKKGAILESDERDIQFTNYFDDKFNFVAISHPRYIFIERVTDKMIYFKIEERDGNWFKFKKQKSNTYTQTILCKKKEFIIDRLKDGSLKFSKKDIRKFMIKNIKG